MYVCACYCAPVQRDINNWENGYEPDCMETGKVGNRIRRWPEKSPFNSYNSEELGRAQPPFLDCFTLPLNRGVIVIVVGNEHGDTSSNPGRDWFDFT